MRASSKYRHPIFKNVLDKGDSLHTGNPVWETTEKQHTKKYTCCGAVTIETEAHVWKDGVCEKCEYVCKHSGGEATCTELAECEYCH